MPDFVKHQKNRPAALPAGRAHQDATDEIAGGPLLTVPGETRPIHEQPIRFLPRAIDRQPGLAFVVDPATGEAIRWVPDGGGHGPSMTPNLRRELRQAPGAPAPGQLPPRSVSVGPLDIQANRAVDARDADRANALQTLMQMGLPQDQLDALFAEMQKTTNPGDALRRLIEARNARL